MALFQLQIVTPDRKVFDGEAEKIILRTAGGDVCILAHHIDYVAPLAIGECRVTDSEGNTRTAACNGGMVTMANNCCRVMAVTFEWEDEIDLERARKAKEDAEAVLETLQRGDEAFATAEAKLKRAIARIHAAE